MKERILETLDNHPEVHYAVWQQLARTLWREPWAVEAKGNLILTQTMRGEVEVKKDADDENPPEQAPPEVIVRVGIKMGTEKDIQYEVVLGGKKTDNDPTFPTAQEAVVYANTMMASKGWRTPGKELNWAYRYNMIVPDNEKHWVRRDKDQNIIGSVQGDIDAGFEAFLGDGVDKIVTGMAEDGVTPITKFIDFEPAQNALDAALRLEGWAIAWPILA